MADAHPGSGGNYWRFMAMVATSTVIMFFLMYANTFDADHIFWSETRFWMMFLMGGMMMVVMLLFMWGMYKDRSKNVIILAVGAVVMALALWLVRSQATIDDEEYMSAMIPHHSIAIMTSERASLKDPRVRKLAHDIILAQRREIAQMKYLIADIEANGVRREERLPEGFEAPRSTPTSTPTATPAPAVPVAMTEEGAAQ